MIKKFSIKPDVKKMDEFETMSCGQIKLKNRDSIDNEDIEFMENKSVDFSQNNKPLVRHSLGNNVTDIMKSVSKSKFFNNETEGDSKRMSYNAEVMNRRSFFNEENGSMKNNLN